MNTKTFNRCGITASLLAGVIAFASSPASATPGEYDGIDQLSAPILIGPEAGGTDTIPADTPEAVAAGIEPDMFLRVPTDQRSDIEKQIEQDILTALNYERSERGLFPYIFSENLTKIHHRWAKMVASDTDDWPQCPAGFGGFRSCHAGAPNWDINDFLNAQRFDSDNGEAANLADRGAGATSNSVGSGAKAGWFVASLVDQDQAHRQDVLAYNGRFASVAVDCQPDGRTMIEWKRYEYDLSVKNTDPQFYEGSDISSHIPTNFGHRCPQPGHQFSYSLNDDESVVTLTPNNSSPQSLGTGRLTPEGPVVGGNLMEWMHDVAIYRDNVLVSTESWNVYDSSFQLNSFDVAVDDPTRYRFEINQRNDYESSLPVVLNLSSTPPSTTTTTTVPSGGTTTTTVPGSTTTVPGGTTTTTVPATNTGELFHGIRPTRLVDTRIPLRALRLTPNDVIKFRPPYPNAAGFALNITAVRPDGPGFIAAYPCGGYNGTSSLNFTAGRVVANAIIVTPDSNGDVCMHSIVGTDLVVDISGWFEATPDFVPASPSRLLDTREAPHSKPRAGSATRLNVGSPGEGHILNVTVTQTDGPGFVTVYPCNEGLPTASNGNYRPGETRATMTVAKADSNGDICLYALASTHLVVDSYGRLKSGSAPTIRPERMLDSREPNNQPRGKNFSVTFPESNGRGVIINVTAVAPSNFGFVTAYPCGGVIPTASNLNYTPFDGAIPNLVVIDPQAGTEQVCFFSLADTDLVVDLLGYAD